MQALGPHSGLAGLVAITAPCAYVTPAASIIIGLIAGPLFVFSASWLEALKIDDPVGAVPVHFVNGMWGVLAVGIFAVGNPDTAAWNGVESPVTGIVGGSFAQILPQVLEAAAIAIWGFGLSYVFFTVLKRAGLLRSRAEDEIGGLDMPEMGEHGYLTDGIAVPGGQVEEPVVVGVTAPAS